MEILQELHLRFCVPVVDHFSLRDYGGFETETN